MSTIYRTQDTALNAVIPVADYLKEHGMGDVAARLLQAADDCRPYLPRVSEKTRQGLIRRLVRVTEELRRSLEETEITPVSMCTFLEEVTRRAWQPMPATPVKRKAAWTRLHYLAAELHAQLDPQYVDDVAFRDGVRMGEKLLEVAA